MPGRAGRHLRERARAVEGAAQLLHATPAVLLPEPVAQVVGRHAVAGGASVLLAALLLAVRQRLAKQVDRPQRHARAGGVPVEGQANEADGLLLRPLVAMEVVQV
jgi:hypothetical protein